ncbi:restriction endonuclease subunit S [Halomonas sp. MA07-2]|uniref:restriction endonuclease subunit S n=1 Tax=Halomonas sp. MA07-2 TaxID=3440841 RepID=UPI003EE9CFDC
MDESSDMPLGWAWSRLGELGTWSGGGTPSKANKAFWSGGSIPWVSPKDMKCERIKTAEDSITEEAVEKSSAKMIPEGSVLMVTRSGILAHTFPVAVNECAVAVNQDLKTLTPHGGVASDYLVWFLRANNYSILKACAKHGTTVASIDTDRLKNLPVPIAPLSEQSRIVDKIESLFAQLDHGEASLRDVQMLLARYRQSVLKAAVTGQLTADWRAENADRLESSIGLLERILQTHRENWQGRGKYQEPSLETQRLITLPESWTWIRVDTAGDVLLGRQRAPQYHAGETMHPYLRVANVYEDRLELSDVKEMNFDEVHFQKYKLEPGDILLAEGQTPDLVGRPAMFRGEIDNCCFQKTLHRFRSAEWVNPDFALAVFRFYLHSKRFKKSASITTNIGHLTLARFKEIEFPVPSLEEQAEIVSRLHAELSRIAAVELVCSAEFTRSSALRQSILKDAFAGKLVPQDPDDEPASELLARIRAERDAAVPKKSTRKKVTA